MAFSNNIVLKIIGPNQQVAFNDFLKEKATLIEKSFPESHSFLLNQNNVDFIKAELSSGHLQNYPQTDLILLSEQSPKIKNLKFAFFDMDSTLIKEEVVDQIAEAVGKTEQVARITEKAMNGELDFDQALRERVALLKGIPIEFLDKVRQNLNLQDGAGDLLAYLKQNKIPIAVISGGFQYISQPFTKAHGIQFCFANELDVIDGKLSGRLLDDRVKINAQGKRDCLINICQKNGIRPDEVLAVGDGANDIPMLQAAGLGISFRGKNKVKKAILTNIQHQTLTAIIDILRR